MERITLDIEGVASVSALLQIPPRARACYVFAHGAGAGMTHPFMAAVLLRVAGLNALEADPEPQPPHR